MAGQAAAIIALIAAHADGVNAITVGKLVAHVAHTQVKLEKLQVTGCAALIIAQVALQASGINRIGVGRLAVDFAYTKAKV